MPNKKIIDMLNEDREWELAAIMQYMAHHYNAAGLESPAIIEEFKKAAIDEMKHAEAIGERIAYLGGVPTEKRAPVKTVGDIQTMVKDDLKTENDAIERYKKHIAVCEEEKDPTTRRMLEEILGDEEDHADTWETVLGVKK